MRLTEGGRIPHFRDEELFCDVSALDVADGSHGGLF